MGLEEVYTNYKVLRVIPPTGYDTEETDIPVMVRIGRSAGKYRNDTSEVFDELGASYLKMAVSLDDGVTECPVEVTEWDVDRQLGILFVKIPSIPTTGMTLKLWYDPTHADNSNVGAVGSAAGQSVWSNGFAGVWHKPSGGLLLDSTANANHGTIYGATLTTGPLGACLSFDGVGDRADILYSPSLNLRNDLSIMVFSHFRTAPINYTLLAGRQVHDSNYYIGLRDDGRNHFLSRDGAGVYEDALSVNKWSVGTDTMIYWSDDATSTPGKHIYTVGIDDKLETVSQNRANGFASYEHNLRIGGGGTAGGGYVDGLIYAVMIESTVRSPAWIALQNASLKDELIAFSAPGSESLTGNERMRLMPDGTLVANEFVEV